MGLDSCIYREISIYDRNEGRIEAPDLLFDGLSLFTNENRAQRKVIEEVFYRRNHYPLHNYMMENYGCKKLYLSQDKLDNLLKYMKDIDISVYADLADMLDDGLKLKSEFIEINYYYVGC